MACKVMLHSISVFANDLIWEVEQCNGRWKRILIFENLAFWYWKIINRTFLHLTFWYGWRSRVCTRVLHTQRILVTVAILDRVIVFVLGRLVSSCWQSWPLCQQQLAGCWHFLFNVSCFYVVKMYYLLQKWLPTNIVVNVLCQVVHMLMDVRLFLVD